MIDATTRTGGIIGSGSSWYDSVFTTAGDVPVAVTTSSLYGSCQLSVLVLLYVLRELDRLDEVEAIWRSGSDNPAAVAGESFLWWMVSVYRYIFYPKHVPSL